ncbi:hypothetical protein [Paenibacillus alvei]|uniref:hypothetical protein n=1 Tax=Paenibacillus alvei TaxID=44250 RepID=UPI0013DC51B6|nr:hypothetical protein [Paenibacillus alvei]NEZ40736.1 hypothetical protein [Paenibacillus alvei]
MTNFSLTDSDVKTILFTLETLPSLGEEDDDDVQAEINYQLCRSAGVKLINRHSDLKSNEIRVIYASLLAARLINQGEIEVDTETKRECLTYVFSINKLISTFEKEIDFHKLLQS